MDIEAPDGANAVAIAAVGLHAGVGESSGHLTGAADPEDSGAGVAAADLNLSHQDEVELVDGVAFEEDDGPVFTDTLAAVRGQPGVLRLSEAIEGRNGAQGGDELRKRSGFGWGTYED